MGESPAFRLLGNLARLGEYPTSKRNCGITKNSSGTRSCSATATIPTKATFFKYFALNFKFWGLKKLIATCYAGSPIANTELSLFDHEPVENKTTKSPHKIEIVEVEDYNGDTAVDLADVEYLLRNHKNVLTRLKGDGDFRSAECIELLKQADIVVTNPPWVVPQHTVPPRFPTRNEATPPNFTTQ